jgi:hypothetical protein
MECPANGIRIKCKHKNSYMTVAEYVAKKDRIVNTTFIIDADGQGWYRVKGGRVSKELFERENCLPESLIVNNSENSDRSKNWLRA